jgi:hypothetical protein
MAATLPHQMPCLKIMLFLSQHWVQNNLPAHLLLSPRATHSVTLTPFEIFPPMSPSPPSLATSTHRCRRRLHCADSPLSSDVSFGPRLLRFRPAADLLPATGRPQPRGGTHRLAPAPASAPPPVGPVPLNQPPPTTIAGHRITEGDFFCFFV